MGKISKLAEFVKEGSVTLKKVKSPINGELTVKWDSFDGYTILGGGLWQVGGPMEQVWKAAFLKIETSKFLCPKILILGLGGGTIAKLARKKWKGSLIIGVDIDPVIVQLGRDYFGLDKNNVTVHILDASEFLKKNKKERWDVICVDMYLGDKFPEKFESEEFLKDIFKLLNSNGVAIFNRLYYGKHTSLAEKFLKLLKKEFRNVEELHLLNEANVVYIVGK